MKEYDPQSFDHLAEEYDFVASLEQTPDFFLEHLSKNRRRVLDVGCGTGILSHELARHFTSVVGVDISESMLAIARAKRPAPNIEYRHADANHLALNQKFDSIVSRTTLHHLAAVPETLPALQAALEPGGRLIIVDNVTRWPAKLPCPIFLFIVKAGLKFPADLLQHGGRTAWRLLRFRTSRHWLDHIKTDKRLSISQFRQVYGMALPGASFVSLKYFIGVIWQAPDRVN